MPQALVHLAPRHRWSLRIWNTPACRDEKVLSGSKLIVTSLWLAWRKSANNLTTSKNPRKLTWQKVKANDLINMKRWFNNSSQVCVDTRHTAHVILFNLNLQNPSDNWCTIYFVHPKIIMDIFLTLTEFLLASSPDTSYLFILYMYMVLQFRNVYTSLCSKTLVKYLGWNFFCMAKPPAKLGDINYVLRK